jgi:type II secretory pathway component PulF
MDHTHGHPEASTMSLGAEAKAGTAAVKKNWIFFVVAAAAVVVLVLWYDHKNQGKLTQKIASLPVVGKLFA